MGFGRKRNVCNQEKSVMAEKAEKERIQKEAEEAATAAARKAEGQDVEIIALKEEFAAAAAEQDMKMAALEAKVAELQALAAASLPCAFLRKALVEHPTVRLLRALYSFSASLVTAALRLS